MMVFFVSLYLHDLFCFERIPVMYVLLYPKSSYSEDKLCYRIMPKRGHVVAAGVTQRYLTRE